MHLGAPALKNNREREMLFAKWLDEIKEQQVLINTEGEFIGKVNGLTALEVGESVFGTPARITATVYAGSQGVTDIEREVDLGRSIHSKGVLLLTGIPVTDLILWALFFTFLKLEILLAIVFFFSTFMGNMMTIMVSLMVYLIAHNFSLILDLFVRLQDTIFLQIVRIFQIIFPPMQALNVKDVIGTFADFSITFFMFNTIYSFLYILIILFFTVQIFSRKTFED